MKKISLYIVAALALIAGSCKKENLKNPSPLLSSFTVVNAVTDAGPLFVNRFASGGSFSKLQDSVSFQKNKEYGVPNGVLTLKMVAYRDTTQQFLNGSFNLSAGKAYSLYVTGFAGKKDTVYKTEGSFPHYADSAVAVRVINLAIGGPSVNVTLSGSPGSNEFSGLAYKAQSAFKKYALTNKVVNSYSMSFDIRNATTGNVLANYSLPQYDYNYPPGPIVRTVRFKAITLVICGDINAAPYSQNAYNVFAIANY